MVPISQRRRGFTLVELLAVMVLLAILATSVGVSLTGHLERVRLESLFTSIERMDYRSRRDATASGSFYFLHFDTALGQIQQGSVGATMGPKRRIKVGRGMKIDRLRTPVGEFRTMSIRYSPHGQSSTYALRMRTTRGQAGWLLVCGLSGQAMRVDSDDQLESLLQAASARPDTR